MKAIYFTGESKAEIRDIRIPKPSSKQVLIRMKVAGICGSDLHGIYERTKAEIELRNKKAGKELIPGHEPCGVIEEVGASVKDFIAGERVIVDPWIGCNECKWCRSGWDNLCSNIIGYGFGADGCFSEFMIAEARYLVKMPNWLSYEVGAHLACGGGTVYSALKMLHVTTDDTALAMGLGPVGLGGVAVMKAWGARVIGVDVTEERINLAKEMGADEVIDASKENVLDRIKELTGGEGVNVAADFSGSPVGRNNCIDASGVFGRVVFVGERNDTTINPSNQLLGKRITLYSSRVYGYPELIDLLKFIQRHNIKFEKMITHRFPFEKGPEAMKLFQTTKSGKIVLIFK